MLAQRDFFIGRWGTKVMEIIGWRNKNMQRKKREKEKEAKTSISNHANTVPTFSI